VLELQAAQHLIDCYVIVTVQYKERALYVGAQITASGVAYTDTAYLEFFDVQQVMMQQQQQQQHNMSSQAGNGSVKRESFQV
jgi:hypothetical protein